jgi:hypothetical protein
MQLHSSRCRSDPGVCRGVNGGHVAGGRTCAHKSVTWRHTHTHTHTHTRKISSSDCTSVARTHTTAASARGGGVLTAGAVGGKRCEGRGEVAGRAVTSALKASWRWSCWGEPRAEPLINMVWGCVRCSIPGWGRQRDHQQCGMLRLPPPPPPRYHLHGTTHVGYGGGGTNA